MVGTVLSLQNITTFFSTQSLHWKISNVSCCLYQLWEFISSPTVVSFQLRGSRVSP